jgi:hypothetical protein
MDASVWRTLMFAFWNHNVGAGTAYYCIWIDGVPAYAATPKTASSLPASVVPIEGLHIGQYHRTTGPVTASIGAIQSDFQVYHSPNTVALSMAQLNIIAARLFSDPTRPLSSAEWPMT